MHALVRVVWFLVVGWWLGLLWLAGSIALMLSVVFFPFGAYTATKTWHVATLKTSPATVVVEAKAHD